MIYNGPFEYYSKFFGEENRPAWMIYVDKLIYSGIRYVTVNKSDDKFALMSNKQIRILSALMLSTYISCEINEIIFDEDSEIEKLIIEAMINNCKESHNYMINKMFSNVINHFSNHIEHVFLTARSILRSEGESNNE